MPYSEEKHFRVDDMMALCPLCHDAATKGALTRSEQRRLQAGPYNKRRGYASGSLMVNSPTPAVAVGDCLFVGEGPVVSVDDETLLGLTMGPDGEMQMSLLLQDQDGGVLAVIDRNEWVSGDPTIWDLTSDHQILRIRQAPRKIVLVLDARRSPARLRARLWHSGQLIELSAKGVALQGVPVQHLIFKNFGFVNMMLQFDTELEKMTIASRCEHSELVVEPDRVRRLVRCLNAWGARPCGCDGPRRA